MIALETARLRLIAADSALISADLDGSARLAEALGAEIPPDWPQKDLAEVMKEDCSRALEAGCDEYLSKPVFKGAFLEMMTRFAAKKHG